MPTHDIIDNRKEILVDHINRILSSTESARFAVGYFFLSGLTSIADKLKGVKELRLLIGNTTNRETLEQLAEGYRRLELIKDAAEDEDIKAQINILEAAFRGTMTRALAQELNRIRRNGITGQALIKNLGELYYQHNMRDWIDRRGFQIEEQPTPVIVCSEGLV